MINEVEWTTLKLGLSKDSLNLTHPLSKTELDPPQAKLIAPAVGNRFCFPKTEIGGLSIGSPPLKSEKPEPTELVVFSSEYWDFFFQKNLARSCENLLDLVEILPKMAEITLDLARSRRI